MRYFVAFHAYTTVEANSFEEAEKMALDKVKSEPEKCGFDWRYSEEAGIVVDKPENKR